MRTHIIISLLSASVVVERVLRAEAGNLLQDDLFVVALRTSGIIISFHFSKLSDQLLRLHLPLASAFNDALHNGLAEAVMLCGVAKPCYLPTLLRGEERFLSTPETFDLALYRVIGFVLQVGDSE